MSSTAVRPRCPWCDRVSDRRASFTEWFTHGVEPPPTNRTVMSIRTVRNFDFGRVQHRVARVTWDGISYHRSRVFPFCRVVCAVAFGQAAHAANFRRVQA